MRLHPHVVVDITGGQLEPSLAAAYLKDAEVMLEDILPQYSEARGDTILKWFAAHLWASTSAGGVLASEKLGDASNSYARGALGDGINGTHYGQQALVADTLGLLRRLGKPMASIKVV